MVNLLWVSGRVNTLVFLSLLNAWEFSNQQFPSSIQWIPSMTDPGGKRQPIHVLFVIFLYGINDSSHNLEFFLNDPHQTWPGCECNRSCVDDCIRILGEGWRLRHITIFSGIKSSPKRPNQPINLSGVVIAMQLGVVSIFEALVAPTWLNEVAPAPGFYMSPLWLRRIYGIPCMCLSLVIPTF